MTEPSAFRLALVYLLIFAASAFALIAFIYWNTAGFMASQTDETIEAVLGLHHELQRRESEAIATPEEARRANTELRVRMREAAAARRYRREMADAANHSTYVG